MHTPILLQHTEQFLGVTLLRVGSISLYKRNSSELWLLQNPEPHVEVYLINKEILRAS
jgi:hypothetical protein